MTVSGRKLPLVLDPLECLLWVRNGPSATPSGRSAVGGEADIIDRKADIDFRMSAFGGRADVVCQELSGPLLAKNRLNWCWDSVSFRGSFERV